MESINMVLCGLGGQGILFITKVLAEASVSKGYPIMSAETHGMAQRGGSVTSHLRIGEVESSLVRSDCADILLALEENEGYRNLPFLREGGRLYVNSDSGRFPLEEVKAYLEKRRVAYHSTPAGKLAMELGTPMSTNLALLGFFSAMESLPAGSSELRETIKRITPDRLLEANLRIFDAGCESAS